MDRCEMCHQTDETDWFDFMGADMKLCDDCVKQLRAIGEKVKESNRDS